MADLFISVVCASKNEEKDILGLCRSFVEQDYEKKELIIVDDSADSTKQVVSEYVDVNEIDNIIVLDGQHTGCCPARNMGVERSVGEIICYMTADSFFPNEKYLRLINKKFSSNIDAYMPNSVVSNQEDLYADFIHCWQQQKFYLRGEEYSPLTSQGYCVRKDAAVSVGLIETTEIRLPYNVCRDWTLVKKMDSKGCKKEFDKDLLVPHVAPASFEDFIWTHQQRGVISAGYNRYFRNKGRTRFFLESMLKAIRSGLFYLSVFMPYLRAKKLTGYSVHNRSVSEFLMCDIIKTFSFHYGEISAGFK